METKGKWMVAGVNHRNGKWEIMTPDGWVASASGEANAHLIVTAINALKSVNPDNPLAVALNIGEMVKSCKLALVDINGLISKLKWSEEERTIATSHLKQVLSNIEGK